MGIHEVAKKKHACRIHGELCIVVQRVDVHRNSLGDLDGKSKKKCKTDKTKISRRKTKPTKWHVRPAKTQISLGIHPV